ncbi:glycosyltransferase family 2 protein [Candidatus Roizmanbacteria bacterium]|nr:glycosyltransferase family 2 protein [Candidatus Roizmanbacteria bacterium]
MKSFSLIIPVYNEEEILENQLNKLMFEIDKILPHSDYEIVLVENGSQDKTYHIAKKLAKQNSHVKLFHLDSPSYGQAFREGLKQASFDIVVQFDIDFWDTDFLVLSLLLLERYDIIIGSKNMGTSKDKRPLARRIISKFIELFLKIYFDVPFTDTHGMKAIRKKLILPLVDQVQSQNHFFDSELLIMCHYLRYSFKELPVTLQEIRGTRFSFLIRAVETIEEFRKLIGMKRLLVRYAYI